VLVIEAYIEVLVYASIESSRHSSRRKGEAPKKETWKQKLQNWFD
jgi:hypothetical protein